MKKKLFILLACITMVSLLMACAPATTPTTTPTSTAQPIKIGHLACFTGHSAAPNPWDISGMELAIAEYGGEVAGRPIELINEDTASDPTVAVDKAKKLIEVDKVDVLVGPLPADGFIAVSAFDKDYGIPHMAIMQDLQEDFKVGGDVFAHDGTLRNAYMIGFYAYDTMGAKTATVIQDDLPFAEEWLQASMDGFYSRGGEIIQRQRTPMDTMDYGPYLAAMKEADVVFLWMVPDNAFRFVKQYYEYGIDMPLVFAGILTLGEDLRTQIGDDILGLISCYTTDPGVGTPEVNAFVDSWLEVNGNKSEAEGRYPYYAEGCSAYVTIQLFLEAVEATNGDTSPAAIEAALREIEADTPWGPVSFDEDGVGIGNMYIFKVVKKGERYLNDIVATYEQVRKDEPADIRNIAPKM